MSSNLIPNHMHCAICNRAILYVEPRKASDEDKTCSPECKAQYMELQRKRKRSLYMMYGLMALAFVVLILSSTGVLGP